MRRLGASCVRVINVVESPAWHADLDDVDLTLVNLHGEPGEDGTIQGWYEVHGKHFVGSRVEACVIGLNKYLTKLVAGSLGIRTPAYTLVVNGVPVAGDAALSGDRICKPLRGGSSIAVSLLSAVDPIPKHGEWLIEEFLRGDDVTVTVVEMAGRPVALPAVVLRHPGQFYDLDAKVTAGKGHRAIVERPSHMISLLEECERAAVALHARIGARHLSRCDFVVSAGVPHLLETNTTPGISAASNAAECAYAAGLSYDDFVALIIGAALKDRSRRCR